MLELPTQSWTVSPAGLRPPRGPRALLQLSASQTGSVFWDIMSFRPTLVTGGPGEARLALSTTSFLDPRPQGPHRSFTHKF